MKGPRRPVNRTSGTATLVLLLAYAMGLGGATALFAYRVDENRERVRASARAENHAEVVRLALSRPDAERMEWVRDDEFRLGGHLFDVLERSETADSVILVCYDDTAERELELAFARLVRAHDDGTGSASGRAPILSLFPHHPPDVGVAAASQGPWFTLPQHNAIPPGVPFLEQPTPPPRGVAPISYRS